MRGPSSIVVLLGLSGLGGLACAEATVAPPRAAPLRAPAAPPATAQVAAPVEPPPAIEAPAPPPEAQQGPIRLPVPPFSYTLVQPAPVQSTGKKLTLVRIQAVGNAITDIPQWFAQYHIALPTIMDHLPPDVPQRVGKAALAEAIAQADGHTLLIYQVAGTRRLVAVIDSKSRVEGLFDFGAYDVPTSDGGYAAQPVSWAAAEGGVLYVAQHHQTYAKESGGLNGYVTAIDMARGKLLWRSAPLVANSVNFVVADGHIITGYGFTEEPDFLYVLDQATGRVESKLPVATQADYLVLRGNKLYVRTYNTNYVYELRFGD